MASEFHPLDSALLALASIAASAQRAQQLRTAVGVRAARSVIEGQIRVIAELGFLGDDFSDDELAELAGKKRAAGAEER